MCIVWVLFGLQSKGNKPSPQPYETSMNMSKLSLPLSRAKVVGCVHLCSEGVISAFLPNPSRSHLLKLSSCLKLCQLLVMGKTTCADRVTAGGMLFTFNSSSTAIVVPLGEETPSPALPEMYFSCLQKAASKFSTFSCNFPFPMFSADDF